MFIPADRCAKNRAAIQSIINLKKSTSIRHALIEELILIEEVTSGSNFLLGTDGMVYIYLGLPQIVVMLPSKHGTQFQAYLDAVYGLVQSTTLARLIYEKIRNYALIHGTRVELRRFSSYNNTTKTAYLSTYGGAMYRMTGADQVETIPNGDDGIFFADDDGGVCTNTNIAPHGKLLDKIAGLNFTTTGAMTADQQRKVLTIWLFALAFPDLLPSKPVLLLEGPQGSGKSTAVRLMQLALMGGAKPMILSKNKADDFSVSLLRSPIAVFDNTDTYIDWLPDQICAYTTGAVWSKRELFTTAGEVVIKPHAFIAVASKNPASFRREDTIDRMLILHLDRFERFVALKTVEDEVLNDRSELFGEYVWFVNQVVKQLRIYADESFSEVNRMADFATIARAVVRVMDWPADTVDNLSNALDDERDAFINEEDMLVDLLTTWVPRQTRATGYTNIYRPISITGLYTELKLVAGENGMEGEFYRTPRLLAQKLRSPYVGRMFNVKVQTIGNHKQYRIGRITDPDLTSIPDDMISLLSTPD